jgi:chromosome segregation ATPase
MKTKIIIIVLLIICVGLCVGLVSIKQDAEKQQKEDSDKIALASNQLIEVNTKLQDDKQVILTHEKDNAALLATTGKLSNDLNSVNADLAKTQSQLKASQEETAKRDARITELENQNTALDKQADDLKANIGNLEGQITDTKRKLDASEGDKAFLTKELNRLVAEKADLEKQFNDLDTLRQQVKKLQNELYASRQNELIREGVYARNEQKGAQRLMQGAFAPAGPVRSAPVEAAALTNHVDLNVEINSDGTVKQIPAITNTPAPAPPAGQ